MTITAPLTSTPAATLARRLGSTPMPHTTPAGPLWTDGRRVMLAGRVLNHDDLSGLCALLLGQPVPDDHPVFRSQALTPLRDLPKCDLRVLPAESDPDVPDQDGPDDVGLALRVSGTWHLGRVISHASGSCAWHEEVHLGGDWITSVTLYPGYSDQDCRDAVSRVAVLADKNANNRVEFLVSGGTVRLTAEGDYGRGHDTLAVEQSGTQPAMSLAFNARHVLDALAPIEGDVQVSLSGSTTPAIFQSGDYQAVLVTLRV